MANDNYQQPSMFTDEEMNSIAAEPQANYGGGPVTVLGMTFPDDEERRRYFREELRKRLPELRKIEGFPIGSDDDIIALSDPPYYTACPNPWLNDFIAEWEQEKKQLEAEGKRSADFEVTEPYSADVSEGKNNPIYNAHTYHTKVPHPAIMRYLMHYTQPGDIIFDGFAGTGMTGVAAGLCDENLLNLSNQKNLGLRHAICSDLSPAASHIASVYNIKQSSMKFVEKAKSILLDVVNQCQDIYKTYHTNKSFGVIKYVVWSDVFICPTCGKELVFYDIATDKKTGKVKKQFKCNHCGTEVTKKSLEHAIETKFDEDLGLVVEIAKTVPVLIKYKIGSRYYTKIPDEYDLEQISKYEHIHIENWIPTEMIQDGYNTSQPIRTNGIKYIHQFYHRRTLYILSLIYNKVKNDKALLLWFTSQLINLSKLNRYRPEVSFPYNPLNGTLYVASQVCEANVFEAYENKIEKISKALALLAPLNLISINSATEVPLLQNSVDYIFTDPPFGANIMYSDLNCIWEGWLKVKTNSTPEAIVNSYQQKSLFDYQVLMNRSLREFYRVLKPGKWLTMEFSNTSAAVWNSIQNALQGVGFVVASVSALDKKQGSFKAVTTTTAVKQDLIISCFKPTAEMIARFEQSGDATENAWAFIEMVLNHLDPTVVRNGELQIMPERTPRILYDKLLAHYVAHGFAVPMNSQDFQKELHALFIERDGMYFTPDQALEYEEQKKKTPVGAETSLFVSSEREGIEWLRRELIKPQTYAELTTKWMSQLQTPKKGDAIPELMDILKENFIKEDDGRWVIPDFENQAHLTEMRNKRLRKQFGLFVEQADRARRLTDTNIEALRFGFTECYKEKDFATIVKVAEKLPESLLMEDEKLLMYYDIAVSHV